MRGQQLVRPLLDHRSQPFQVAAPSGGTRVPGTSGASPAIMINLIKPAYMQNSTADERKPESSDKSGATLHGPQAWRVPADPVVEHGRGAAAGSSLFQLRSVSANTAKPRHHIPDLAASKPGIRRPAGRRHQFVQATVIR